LEVFLSCTAAGNKDFDVKIHWKFLPCKNWKFTVSSGTQSVWRSKKV